MYSVPFLIMIVAGIAVVNLFLGFAAALLAGRGPQRWSDLDRIVKVRYFSPALLFGKDRPAERQTEIDADPLLNPRSADDDQPPQVPCAEPSFNAECGSTRRDNDPERFQCGSVVRKFTLSTDQDGPPPQNVPPPQFLDEQLRMWREQPEPRDTPSLSGLSVEALTEDVDPSTLEALLRAVESRVAGQLRRDRRVLHIAERQFAWFSDDVEPDDAMMPLNRIRQLLETTRFTVGTAAIHLRVAAAVVAGTDRDSGHALLARLQSSLQFAAQQCAQQTARDIGSGPEPMETPALDLDESVCALPA
jgi:hypothetical protein